MTHSSLRTIVGTGGTQQYQVVKIDNENSPAFCAGLPIAGGAFAVASVRQNDGYAYSYIVTGDTRAELKMILGGAGGEFTSSGTFESATLAVDHSTAFNRFQATVSQPAQTTLQLQIAVAKANVGGNCSGVSFTYLGPGGDPSQYFTVGADPTLIQGIIPLITLGNYSNPGQCFRYKGFFLSTESTATPVIYDFTVNYSP